MASKGRLRDAGVLEQQVTRMLADPKADALIENFAGQWLYLRELDERADRGARTSTTTCGSRSAAKPRCCSMTIVREDRSLIDLLDADYTFVDERLARHYGIPNVRGSYFRRVSLPADSPRRGLLGHGSMLTVTSIGHAHLAGLARQVDSREPARRAAAGAAAGRGDESRAAPKARRADDAAAAAGAAPREPDLRVVPSHHGPDRASRSRTSTWSAPGARPTAPSPIDATGQLADGTPLSGPADLRQALLSRSDAFVTTATEKLMTYALGRPVHYYDMPDVRAIARRRRRTATGSRRC